MTPSEHRSHNLRPDAGLENMKRAEQAAMAGLGEQKKWLVPLTLALARLAAARDIAELGASYD